MTQIEWEGRPLAQQIDYASSARPVSEDPIAAQQRTAWRRDEGDPTPVSRVQPLEVAPHSLGHEAWA